MLLNCKGLLSRDPAAALELIQGEHIVIFTETWLGATAVPPQLEGYKAYHFPRPGAGIRGGSPRGGVVIYLALDLADHASVWPDERGSEGGQSSWLQIDAAAGFQQDVFLAGCYFEPNAPEDAWAEFEEQAAEAAGLGWVLSAGDFNARTQSRNTGQGRVSEDTVRPSRQGLRLLQLIEAVGLTIANGATAGATSGHYTFQGHNGKSVVDYFLLCPPLMQAATRLDVEHLPPHTTVWTTACCASL